MYKVNSSIILTTYSAF